MSSSARLLDDDAYQCIEINLVRDIAYLQFYFVSTNSEWVSHCVWVASILLQIKMKSKFKLLPTQEFKRVNTTPKIVGIENHNKFEFLGNHTHVVS